LIKTAWLQRTAAARSSFLLRAVQFTSNFLHYVFDLLCKECLSMSPTRNDLANDIRTKVCATLNERLADSIKLGLCAKQAHWNVKGENFIALHKLFDEVYSETEAFVDDIAERITALGGLADGSVASLAKSRVADHPTTKTNWKGHVTALSDELAAYGKIARADIDNFDKLGDKGTADLLTGISRTVDKYLWFVESHLQD
jgi:starvation-inducible DNA-binding protein